MRGYGAAHVALNTEYNVIFISNYGSGSMAVYSVDPSTGAIGDEPLYSEAYEGGSGVVPDRQEAAHAHGAFFFGDNAYVCDLGGDKIWQYKVWKNRTRVVRIRQMSSFHILLQKSHIHQD